MKRLFRFSLASFLLMFALAFAFAQGVADIPLDFANWFVDAAKLSVAVVAIVAAGRKYVFKTLDGSAVPIAALVLAVFISVLGFFLHQFGGALDLFGAIIYGLTAGIQAVALVEGGRAVTGTQSLPSGGG